LATDIIRFLIEKKSQTFYTEDKPPGDRRFIVFRKVEDEDRKNNIEITFIDKDRLSPGIKLLQERD